MTPKVSTHLAEEAVAPEETWSALEQLAAVIQEAAERSRAGGRSGDTGATAADGVGRAVVAAISALWTLVERVTVIQDLGHAADLLAVSASVREVAAPAAAALAAAGRPGDVLGKLAPAIEELAERVRALAAAAAARAADATQVTIAARPEDEGAERGGGDGDEPATGGRPAEIAAELLPGAGPRRGRSPTARV